MTRRAWPRLRRGATIALACGLGLAALSGVMLARGGHSSQPADFGPSVGAAAPAAVGSPAASAPRQVAPDLHTHPHPRPSPKPPATLSPPHTLRIPGLHVTAKVVPVLAEDRQLQVPDDPQRVGWWIASALPGQSHGPVVIDGHVDTASAGPGALFELTKLHPGARIWVTTTSGTKHGYRVVSRRTVAKTTGLPARLFDPHAAPGLVLITCGGPFDRRELSYLDNIVVYATPA